VDRRGLIAVVAAGTLGASAALAVGACGDDERGGVQIEGGTGTSGTGTSATAPATGPETTGTTP
jgi:hypothetical protein